MSSLLKSAAAFSAIALLTACGGSGTEAETPSAPAATTTTQAAPTATPVAAPAAVPAGEPSAEFANLPAPYNTADYARGKRTFKLCVSCHLTAEGAGNLVGPNLHGLFGREAGSLEGFAYSDALTDADFIWEPVHLDEWLTNPRAFLPGNRMSFAGVRKPEDRLGLIAYLMVESGYSAPAAEETPAP
ncbi:MAG: cytochrome c family protein [Hyphomonas sp.]|tara:strand:- start:233 stop:793 length:561 start_codon:yes stop_codon:yes gene_type:complete